MNIKYFESLKQEKDPLNPFINKYIYDDGSCFYIEPTFYTQLVGFETYHKESFPLILKRLEEVVRKNKKVVFVSDFENYNVNVDDSYIILEITDITDPLHIYSEDKSRGSDYGD